MTEVVADVMDPARANALLVALGRAADLETGAPLPPFFHQLYFWAPQPPDRLGPDGHPAVGQGLIPDMGLPRRMWAGGRLAFLAPLRAGQRAERLSRCEDAVHKQGRSGPMGLVTLCHEIRQDGQLRVREMQDLVYVPAPDPTAPRRITPARADEETRHEVRFDSTLLFRYSALTCNGHRIHYDLDYARDVEGYAGLVVHGPLLAQLLMLWAAQELGPLSAFDFRALSPVMHVEVVTLCRAGQDLWVRGPDGRLCMTAQAVSE